MDVDPYFLYLKVDSDILLPFIIRLVILIYLFIFFQNIIQRFYNV